MPPVARPTLQPVCCGAPGPVLLRHPGRDRGGRGGGVRHVSAGRLYPGTRVSSACPGVSHDCADVLPAGPGVRRGPVLGAARLQRGGRGDHGTAVYCRHFHFIILLQSMVLQQNLYHSLFMQ